jgi:hypothetical protein
MTENQNTSRAQRLRTFVRYVWGDQLAASRALLGVRPYDDWLINHRDHR